MESVPAILGNHNQSIWGDILLLQVGVFLGYVLHHTRGKAVKVNQVVSLLLWQVREKSSRRFDQLESGLVPRCLCRCIWFVRPWMQRKDDPFHGNGLQRFPGLKPLFQSLSPSFYFCRDWPGAWLFPGSSLLAQRCRQILNNNNIFELRLMRL